MEHLLLRTGFYSDLPRVLDKLKLDKTIKKQERIILKPNLIANLKPPVTTSAEFIKKIIDYVLSIKPKIEITVAEGSGLSSTEECFDNLGYREIENAKLIDLEGEKRIISKCEECLVLKELPLPKIILDGFLISVACLKHHSSAGVTLSLKNMIGIVSKELKARSHSLGLAKCIVDINLHRKPDFAIIDGIVGQIESELYGIPRQFNVLIAGYDPVAADSIGAKILGKNPKEIEHIKLAEEKKLGKIVD